MCVAELQWQKISPGRCISHRRSDIFNIKQMAYSDEHEHEKINDVLIIKIWV